MSIVERILKIVENKGISANKMTEILGVSGTYFYKQKTNNGNVGSQILMKIVEVYPDISPEWLLTGKGSMLRDAQPTTPTPSLRDTPAISLCPELVAQVAELKATIAEKDRIISHLSKSMEALTTYINALEKPLKNIPIPKSEVVKE